MAEKRTGTTDFSVSQKPIKRFKTPAISTFFKPSESDSNKVKLIRDCWTTIQSIVNFIHPFPKRKNCLQEKVELLRKEDPEFNVIIGDSLVTRLRTFSDTRWIDRHDGVTVFKKLLFASIDALNEMKHWNTGKDAQSLLNSVDFKFLISLCVLERVLRETATVAGALQRTSIDLIEATEHINRIRGDFSDWRAECDIHLLPLFNEAVDLAKKLNVTIEMPRLVGRQRHRDNTEAQNEEEYYRKEIPTNITETLKCCDPDFFPNINVLLKVDEESEKHGGLLVADVLKAHNVEQIFTLCGGHISPILVACEKAGIRVVDTRHEVTTVFAADAVARLTQGIGVAAVTAGPVYGLTNTVTAIKNAQMAESPLLLLGGAAASLLKGRGSLQDIDQMVLFRPLCKFCATITRVRDIVPTLRKAIQAAQSGTPGPVFVEFPIDTLYPYKIIHRELGVTESPKSLGQRVVNWYLESFISGQFGNAWIKQNVTPIPLDIQMPKDEQVEQAANLLMSSEKPLIILGSQATLPPIKPNDLRHVLEEMGVPCYLGGMCRGLLGRNGNLHIRQNRRDALKEADVVILAGSVCDFRMSYGRVLNRRSKVIAINRNKGQLFKNTDMFWKPTIAVQGDVGVFINRLGSLLKSRSYKGCPNEWLESLREKDQTKEAKNEKLAEQKPENHLNPIKVCIDLENSIPDDAILVADGGDFIGTAAYTMRPRGPLHWLDPGAFGTLGVGGGFALGAKLVFPDKPVWILYGDGSCGYSIMEFDTYERHNLPIVAVVGNDGCWSQIAREQVPMFGTSVGCDLKHSDYDEVVKPFGCVGMKVTRDNEKEIKEICHKAYQANKEGKSALINVYIGKSSFREGSISV